MAVVGQPPEATVCFQHPAFVLQQAEVRADSGLFAIQPLRDAACPHQRVGRLQKLSEDGFHQHLVSSHHIPIMKIAMLKDGQASKENRH